MSEFDFLLEIDLFKKSLSEQKSVIYHFWSKGEQILEGSGINLKPVPREWTSWKHNYFSVLFIAVFFLFKISLPRLKLFARLNHCLRSWVTACDNLLDDELKELIITDLPDDARIFKSVHTLLVTDRIFFSFLMDAVKDKTITKEEMEQLLNISLSSISVSGREEAEEEGGVDYSLSPEEILNNVHLAKTGRLFSAPLAAPMALGDIEEADTKFRNINNGLISLGIGCQILDDLSDIGMDLYNRKYNYLAALIMHGQNIEEKQIFSCLTNDNTNIDFKDDVSLYQKFPQSSNLAINASMLHLQNALDLLCEGGLPLGFVKRRYFINILISTIGRPDMLINLRNR